MKVYKLFRVDDQDNLHPLFINRKQTLEIGKWYQAEEHRTRGFAVRKGWHCTLVPHAPHLKLVLKSGERRVWCLCEVECVQYYERPESQGGTWVLAQYLRVISRC